MLLAIDIGNTNIKLGVWNGRSWQHEWRLQAVSEKTADEYGPILLALLNENGLGQALDHAIIASVVPKLTQTFTAVCQRHLRRDVIEVSHLSNTGITIDTDNPAAVGTDRIANATAVHHTRPGASIIVDMGTATKFEILTQDGVFCGGVIAPGLRITADALASRAAKLSQVELVPPPNVIGRNTIHAVQSGLIYGYIGLIEGVLARLLQEHPNAGQPIQVIGTGGLINHIAPYTNAIHHVDGLLTLTGLRIISERMMAKG